MSDHPDTPGGSTHPAALAFGNWDEPDAGVLDQLTHQAVFAADSEALRPGPPSRIPNPDGTRQGETGHERTRRIARATLRMLLANGLVAAVPQADWPEYVVLDPPNGAFA